MKNKGMHEYKTWDVTLSQKKASSLVAEEYPKAPPKSHIEILRHMRKKSCLSADLQSLRSMSKPSIIAAARKTEAINESMFICRPEK